MTQQSGALQLAVITSAQLTVDRRHAVLSLCSRAYQEDFAPYLDMLGSAVHVLGELDGRLVSHAAWVERELRADGAGALRTAYIEAVATDPAHQGRGFATHLLSALPPLLTEFDLAALSPSDEAFYARLGWEPWRGPLAYQDPDGGDIETPDEAVMIHRLPRTPHNLDLTARLSTDWRPLEVW